MDSAKHFKKLGQAYLDAVEGAVGCRLDADYHGKTFAYADLTATLRRFYLEWAPVVENLSTGQVYLNAEGARQEWMKLHSADSISPRLRESCRTTSGIYLVDRLQHPERIRSLLMFADAILFWDPLEDAFRGGRLDPAIVDFALAELRAVRPLIAAGLVVPAQVIRAKTDTETLDGTIRSQFAENLMYQGALGRDAFKQAAKTIEDGSFEVDVPSEMMTAKGYLGYAENKLAATILPDVVIPLMNFNSLSSYQDFCKALDEQLLARQIEFVHQSLAFETGFLIDPDKLNNEMLLELRERDVIFRSFRETVLQSVQRYEDELATGHGAKFITTFNAEMKKAFADLKEAAHVSNTWKEFVDERRSLSTRIVAKVAEHPLLGKHLFDELGEVALDAGATSLGNLLAAATKTYKRYRNTKILMDFAASVRKVHEEDDVITI
ncbi:MAG: hypothetical protein J7500_14545 [Sphingomonas sp.]|uniref:hypothetical protein n=1 Tax=Sphingomonas sp. TaxID=28214 RepID=UPI001B2433FC|nr:hypothetical protein [Sphingomonas sp.]MBO9623925.1 hypothetical protein [Sphingomonas sp.]